MTSIVIAINSIRHYRRFQTQGKLLWILLPLVEEKPIKNMFDQPIAQSMRILENGVILYGYMKMTYLSLNKNIF